MLLIYGSSSSLHFLLANSQAPARNLQLAHGGTRLVDNSVFDDVALAEVWSLTPRHSYVEVNRRMTDRFYLMLRRLFVVCSSSVRRQRG
jgi:hypothetical protein